MKISIDTTIISDIGTVWNSWTEPEHITQWNFASEEWHCPKASNDLKPGGSFSYRMEAKDRSMGFDFSGNYVSIVEHTLITFSLGDDRIVEVHFNTDGNTTTITEIFEAEDQNSGEQQRAGWQSILDNFKAYVESL